MREPLAHLFRLISAAISCISLQDQAAVLLMCLTQDKTLEEPGWSHLQLWPQLGPSDPRPGCPSGLTQCRGPQGSEPLERGRLFCSIASAGSQSGGKEQDGVPGITAGGEPTESSTCRVLGVQAGERQLCLLPHPTWSPNQRLRELQSAT